MASKFPPCPVQLKSVQHYLKLASDYEPRNPTISYYAILHALQCGMKIDRKSPEAKSLLAALLDWLEAFKKNNKDNESISSDIAGQATIENEALKLFTKADAEDRASHFTKNTVKLFYTSGVLFDVCELFGQLSEEVSTSRKYAKWKATYIHNCLKNGEQPVPGPIGGDEELTELESVNKAETSFGPEPTTQQDDTPFKLPAINNTDIPSDNIPQAFGYIPEEPPKTQGQVNTEQMMQAQKFCKYAVSALDYEDTKTAIDNLVKALALLNK